MNRPKTNTYPKHYDISDGDFFAVRGISPKPWHPVFATQVDKFIQITCDKCSHYSQNIANFLHNILPHPRVLRRPWYDLVLRCTWLRFSEHSNRPVDVEGLVPPEDVYHEIHGRIRKRHDFEMSDWKVFLVTCYGLDHEPRRLEQDEGFGEPVALPPVLDFFLGWYCK